jgi:hypothetical protein
MASRDFPIYKGILLENSGEKKEKKKPNINPKRKIKKKDF